MYTTMTRKPTLGARLIAWAGRWACRLGSHNWEVLESKIEHNIETATVVCTRPGCGHEETFTEHLYFIP